jgi:hypothetical protein
MPRLQGAAGQQSPLEQGAVQLPHGEGLFPGVLLEVGHEALVKRLQQRFQVPSLLETVENNEDPFGGRGDPTEDLMGVQA